MKAPATSLRDRQSRINRGEIETKNLTECLKVDFAILYRSIFPKSSAASLKTVIALQELGILKRMEAMSLHLLHEHGAAIVGALAEAPSDTARGWAAFCVGQLQNRTLKSKLDQIARFADDSHFGVREWAWLSLRRDIADQVEEAIRLLTAWTTHDSFRVRRFASEATRPRGVWCPHIEALKRSPQLGLPILTPLRHDTERYVQDSVGNWLNDAAKSDQAWVKKLCASWSKTSNASGTAYIVKRAQRSFK